MAPIHLGCTQDARMSGHRGWKWSTGWARCCRSIQSSSSSQVVVLRAQFVLRAQVVLRAEVVRQRTWGIFVVVLQIERIKRSKPAVSLSLGHHAFFHLPQASRRVTPSHSASRESGSAELLRCWWRADTSSQDQTPVVLEPKHRHGEGQH